MMHEGGETPLATDDELEERYQMFGEHEDMDPEEGISSGEMESGEVLEGISKADLDSVEPLGDGPGEADDAHVHPPPEPHPQGRQSATDRLRAEAQSMEHKLSHLPKNPFCQACTMGK